MTLEILICSLNKGIVRIADVLLPPRDGVRYIVSYQYTDERYLDLVPAEVESRDDVAFYKYNGQGLSANRNLAMEKSTADLVMFADDDSRLSTDGLDKIFEVFDRHPDLDVAFFRASTYTGKPLKDYPEEEMQLTGMPKTYVISAIEMVCRREKVQRTIRFDERFGLGTKFLTCGEEEIWMEDARRIGLKMRYFPIKTVETSTLLKKSMIYVYEGVQRSFGALAYYRQGRGAWLTCLRFAFSSARAGYCHFWPMFRHLAEGIRYMRKTE
ncbi:MAG: glycosyltransferase [Alloprevotella sp.]|nr:glycosyltransferase [Alloprevotella sp.]